MSSNRVPVESQGSLIALLDYLTTDVLMGGAYDISLDSEEDKTAINMLRKLNRPEIESEAINQINLVIPYIEARFLAADPHLIRVQTLERLENGVEPLFEAVSRFGQTRDDPAHLNRALDQLNEILAVASELPQAISGQAEDLIIDVVGPFRKEIEELRSQTRNQLGKFKEESE